MNPNTLNIENVDNEAVIETSKPPRASGALALYGLLIFTHHAGRLKNDVAEKGADISQRQEKIKFIHGILQTINKLSNEKGFDVSQDKDLQEKLKIAKEMGVDFDETCLKFSPEDRDFLKESLQLTVDDLSNENKLQTQKMQMLIQEADRWLTLANTLLKNNEKTTKSIIDKIR